MASSTPKPILLAIGPMMIAKNWENLGQYAELKIFPDGTRQDFITALQNREFDGVVGIFRTVESTHITGVFDEEIIPMLPDSLKYICQAGAGYDNVNVALCSARGIQVSNSPHVNDKAVADMAIWLMIGALRRADMWYRRLRAGEWRGAGAGAELLGRDPEGKLLGVIGMGAIGQAIAQRARGFEMRIQYHNRSRLAAELEAGAAHVDLDTLLATSDVVVLGLAYTPALHHFLGRAEFAKMKKGVTVVNIARGHLIDEAALLEAVGNGTVWSAGLDVFEEEPTKNTALLNEPRIFLSPHIGAGTIETYARMESEAFHSLASALTTGKVAPLVPEQHGIF